MRKVLLSGLLVLGVSAAEISGAFVGIEAGGGQMSTKETPPTGGSSKNNATLMNYGLNAGYKTFFGESIGARFYANFNYATMSMKMKDPDATTKMGYDFLTYAANADLLFNFTSETAADFGAFVGVGLGGQSYSDKVATTKTVKANGLYADAKLGLRVTAANHGMELVAKIPFTQASGKFTEDKATAATKIKARQNFQVVLGYNYTF